MSAQTTITVAVPPHILRDIEAYQACRRTVTEGAAMGIEAGLRDHFMRLQEKPRADKLQPVGFWYGTDGNSVAEKISGHVVHDDGSASVEIDSPELRHKLDGGVIKASDYGHTYLTLPATDAAAQAAQGARSFVTHIEWVLHPDGGMRPALVSGKKPTAENFGGFEMTESGTTGRRKTKDGSDESTVLFWLIRQASHKPMPGALPSDSEMLDAARDAALDALDALINSRGAA
jgi:hypothetical protein